jgi:hypothetical protein
MRSRETLGWPIAAGLLVAFGSGYLPRGEVGMPCISPNRHVVPNEIVGLELGLEPLG